jgi:serine/threonine-protein kinase
MLGTLIGKYRIVEPLGRGGMGTVYRAIDETLNREVAIKVLNPELADKEVMQRFLAEATTLARMNHPEIATIYDLHQSEQGLLMVMEFIKGETLDRLTDRCGPLPPEQAATIIARVLGALDHAHRAGIVHRDLKPANVMVTVHGTVKVMDFGIAHVTGGQHITLDGYMMGTPAYMPPEQVLGHEVDGRADVYAAGVLLYRLLTAALPFRADTPIAMVQKQVAEAPLPLHEHRQGLPPWCEAVLRRALAKAPPDRYQTAEEFRRVLSESANLTATEPERSLTPPPAVPTLSLPPAVRAADGTVDGATLVLKRRHVAAGGMLIGVSAAAVTILAFSWLMQRNPPPVEATIAARPTDASLTAATVPVAGASVPAPPPPLDLAGATTRPSSPAAPTTLLPLVFDAKALVIAGDRARERDSLVVLGDGRLTVTADNKDVLHALQYEEIVSTTYSTGRDPMWKAPAGPMPAARVSGGTLGFIRGARHWIVVRASGKRMVILRVPDNEVDRVLTALGERTGRVPDRLVARADK